MNASILLCCVIFGISCRLFYAELFPPILHVSKSNTYRERRLPSGNECKPVLELATKQHQISVITEKPESTKLTAFDLCVCGAFATMFGDFVMHPIDTIKVMQQTSVGSLNMLMAARKILVNQGPAGFYQGVVPYLAADGISGAIKFATFEVTKLFAETNFPIKWHPLAQFICAAGAFLACSVVLVPGEVLKIRMQAGSVKSLASGMRSILQEDGIGGFFAGYGATLLRDVPYTMLELGIYENLKAFLKRKKKVSDFDQRDELLAAAITGGITGFITTPLDVVKTKLMMQSTSSGTNIFGTFLSICRTEGVASLFTGSVARVAWLLPFTTIYLGVYEAAKRELIRLKKCTN